MISSPIKKCERCERPYKSKLRKVPYSPLEHGTLEYVIVEHAYYGCDTGCCGHMAVAFDSDNNRCEGKFEFDHNYGTRPNYKPAPDEEWATEFAGAQFPNVPLKFDECTVSQD